MHFIFLALPPAYGAPPCLKLPAKILFDISKGKDPKPLNLNLALLLPAVCPCLPPLKGMILYIDN